MLIPNHPADEGLSELASHDSDASADRSLVDHVSSCARCTELVDELRTLRASLAELPDIAPPRPLRLLPPAEDPAAATDSVGSWARRLFAPILTAGAALALVGVVGTAAPALGGFATGQAAAPAEDTSVFNDSAAERPGEAEAQPSEGAAFNPAASAATGDDLGAESSASGGQAERLAQVPAERSPWPMVLFGGVALMVLAALLRWILVPRAG